MNINYTLIHTSNFLLLASPSPMLQFLSLNSKSCAAGSVWCVHNGHHCCVCESMPVQTGVRRPQT